MNGTGEFLFALEAPTPAGCVRAGAFNKLDGKTWRLHLDATGKGLEGRGGTSVGSQSHRPLGREKLYMGCVLQRGRRVDLSFSSGGSGATLPQVLH
jgi:hypothetical protein